MTTSLFYSRYDKQFELEHGMPLIAYPEPSRRRIPLIAYPEPSRPNVTDSSDESDSDTQSSDESDGESESLPWSYLKK